MRAISLLTLGTLADALEMSRPTVRRLRKKGVIQPDFEAGDGDSFLFDPSRVPAIRADILNIHREPTPTL